MSRTAPSGCRRGLLHDRRQEVRGHLRYASPPPFLSTSAGLRIVAWAVCKAPHGVLQGPTAAVAISRSRAVSESLCMKASSGFGASSSCSSSMNWDWCGWRAHGDER